MPYKPKKEVKRKYKIKIAKDGEIKVNYSYSDRTSHCESGYFIIRA